ncbi:RNA-directed DNA polymerase, eukaryota, reverse transcriptase zinc-binding domain protein [Tanacetum coccineum]
MMRCFNKILSVFVLEGYTDELLGRERSFWAKPIMKNTLNKGYRYAWGCVMATLSLFTFALFRNLRKTFQLLLLSGVFHPSCVYSSLALSSLRFLQDDRRATISPISLELSFDAERTESEALGWLLEEIHVTWAHLGKKQTRLQLYTKVKEEKGTQTLETASGIGMMKEIDISTLTVEQYFRMIDEIHAPGMVNEEFGRTMEKDIEDMTIAEYMKYEAEMKRKSWRDSQSYFPTKYDNWDVGSFHLEKNKTSDYPEQGTIDNTDAPDAPNLESHDEGMSSDEVDEWFVIEMEEHAKRGGNDEDALINIMKSLVEECKTIYKCRQMKTFEIDTVLEASSMASNDTVEEDSRPSRTLPCQLQPKELSLGSFSLPYTIVENVLVKIDKFVSPCDFVVIDMSGICGEMMILGKPFLATIHAQIYVFNGEISFGTSEDRVKFNVNRISHHSNAILEKVYMTTEKESFNPLEIEDGLFSYESPACLRFEQNTRIYTNSDNETIDSPTNMQETSKRRADHQQDNKRDTSRWHVLDTKLFMEEVNMECSNNGGTTYAWHDEGHEEEELWKCGIDKAEYAPPIVNIETSEVKRFQQLGGKFQDRLDP